MEQADSSQNSHTAPFDGEQLVTDGTNPAIVPGEQKEVRLVVVKLLKTMMRGGVLTLTNRELVLGEGFLGVRNVRRFPLTTLARLDVIDGMREGRPQRDVELRFVWMDGETTVVQGLGPVAAQRIQYLLKVLRRPAAREYAYGEV